MTNQKNWLFHFFEVNHGSAERARLNFQRLDTTPIWFWRISVAKQIDRVNINISVDQPACCAPNFAIAGNSVKKNNHRAWIFDLSKRLETQSIRNAQVFVEKFVEHTFYIITFLKQKENNHLSMIVFRFSAN